MGKTALMRDIVEGTLSRSSVSTLTSWDSVWIKHTTMQICTLHYPKDFQLSQLHFYDPPHQGVQGFRRGIQESPGWSCALGCPPGVWKLWSSSVPTACLTCCRRRRNWASSCWSCPGGAGGPGSVELDQNYLLCKKQLWTSLAETFKDQVRRKDLFPVTLR